MCRSYALCWLMWLLTLSPCTLVGDGKSLRAGCGVLMLCCCHDTVCSNQVQYQASDNTVGAPLRTCHPNLCACSQAAGDDVEFSMLSLRLLPEQLGNDSLLSGSFCFMLHILRLSDLRSFLLLCIAGVRHKSSSVLLHWDAAPYVVCWSYALEHYGVLSLIIFYLAVQLSTSTHS